MSVESVKAISSEPRTPASDVSPAVKREETLRARHASGGGAEVPVATVRLTVPSTTKPTVIETVLTTLKKGG